MSVQAYTSQFIKEGLRIKMKQKMGSSSAGLSYMTNELPSPSEEDVKPPKVKRIRLGMPFVAGTEMRRKELS